MTRQGAETAVMISALVVGGLYGYRKMTEGVIAAGKLAKDGSGLDRAVGPSSKVAQALGAGSPPAPAGKFLVGFGFTYLALAVLAAGVPDLAGAMAILIALACILTNGVSVFSDLKAATA